MMKKRSFRMFGFVAAFASAMPVSALAQAYVPIELHGMEQAPDLPLRAEAGQRFASYSRALKERDFASAYSMLRLSLQAATPRLEWEMGLRQRGDLWADGDLRILRQSWYLNPEGQPAGFYAAFDFRGDRADGSMDCGYVVVHQPIGNNEFSVVRTDSSYVPPHLMTEGVPTVDVLRQLPCFLGKGIATAI